MGYGFCLNFKNLLVKCEMYFVYEKYKFYFMDYFLICIDI